VGLPPCYKRSNYSRLDSVSSLEVGLVGMGFRVWAFRGSYERMGVVFEIETERTQWLTEVWMPSPGLVVAVAFFAGMFGGFMGTSLFFWMYAWWVRRNTEALKRNG
jgi:hypothetical protein